MLACAPSNLAVDNLFERLLGFGERVVRLGHPARVLPELREHTLDLLVERHHGRAACPETREAGTGLVSRSGPPHAGGTQAGARRQLREDAKSLLADARRLEMQAVDSILGSASVLCATTTGLDSQVLGTRHFDLAVIDEACQSTEPGCWIPLLRCDRVVLAGDHCQLPPTVISQRGGSRGIRRKPLRAAHGALRPADCPSADGAVPHARGDHGLFLHASSTRASWRQTRRSDSTCWPTCRT